MRVFYDKTIKVKRLKGSEPKRTLQATATGEASIRPLSAEQAALRDGAFGQTYQGFVDSDLPVQVDDTITDGDGNSYVVSAIRLYDMGAFPCKELTLKRTKPVQ